MPVSVEQMIATLRQRAAAYEARHAARAAELRARIEVLAAAEKLRGVELWLIGSTAWGGFGVRSDIDVVARGLPLERVCPLETAWMFALREQVELLRFEELEPSFQERVVREGVSLSAR
jgi:predicted nucleotidyltransferase